MRWASERSSSAHWKSAEAQRWRRSLVCVRRTTTSTLHRRWSRCICVGRTLRRAHARWRLQPWSSMIWQTTHRGVFAEEKGRRMRYSVDEMTMADLPRIVEIERLAYTTPWPPSAYRRELQENRMAHYIVVR